MSDQPDIQPNNVGAEQEQEAEASNKSIVHMEFDHDTGAFTMTSPHDPFRAFGMLQMAISQITGNILRSQAMQQAGIVKPSQVELPPGFNPLRGPRG